MTGLFAAVATPVDQHGRVDLEALDRLIDFLVDAGVDGVCIGGATGEYPHFETADRRAVIERAASRLPRERALLVGVGAAAPRAVTDLGRAAAAVGARALLVPMPMFFRYEQQDLESFCAHVSRALRAPCLLYDLPEFTNALDPATALVLMRDEEFIVGIKDSSGHEENLSRFARARREQSKEWSLLVGDDRLLHAGLQAGWNGGISGVAGFCPELLVALCRSYDRGQLEEAARLQGLLDELISQMVVFPVPWGVRIGLEARGLPTGPLPLPLTAARQEQARRFRQWFVPWLEALRDRIPTLRP